MSYELAGVRRGMRGVGSASMQSAVLAGMRGVGSASMTAAALSGYRRRSVGTGSLRGTSLGGLGSLGIGDWSDYLPDFGGGGGTDPGSGGTDPGQSGGTDPGGGDPAVAAQAQTGQPCGQNGIINSSGDCVDLGVRTSAADCPAGTVWNAMNSICTAPCPAGQSYHDGVGCLVDCPADSLITGPGAGTCTKLKDWQAAGQATCKANELYNPHGGKDCWPKSSPGVIVKPKIDPKKVPPPKPAFSLSSLTSSPLFWAGLAIVLGGGYYLYTESDSSGASASAGYLGPAPRTGLARPAPQRLARARSLLPLSQEPALRHDRPPQARPGPRALALRP